MALIAILVCVALLAITLRRVRGCGTGWRCSVSSRFRLEYINGFQKRRSTPGATTVSHSPMDLLLRASYFIRIRTANAGALRARPWLVIILVPLVYLAAIFLGLIVGVNLDILSP
jgi:hypothetical protein